MTTTPQTTATATATVTIAGTVHVYNPATHMVEIREGMRAIRTARSQAGWITGDFIQRGNGCFIASRLTVLRPLRPRELRQRAALAAQTAARQAQLAAEFTSLPDIAQRALRQAICLRKGKVRMPAALYEQATGKPYTGQSPYGPRLGTFLGSLGIPDPAALIKRHVTGLKPW